MSYLCTTPEERSLKLLMSVVPKADIRESPDGTMMVVAHGKRFDYNIVRCHKTVLLTKKKARRRGAACMQIHEMSVPSYDRMLAEYLLIRNDERSYLRIARITWDRELADWVLELIVAITAVGFVAMAIHTLVHFLRH